jgi:hypothetical protein
MKCFLITYLAPIFLGVYLFLLITIGTLQNYQKTKKPTQWLLKKRNNQSTPVITKDGRLLGKHLGTNQVIDNGPIDC